MAAADTTPASGAKDERVECIIPLIGRTGQWSPVKHIHGGNNTALCGAHKKLKTFKGGRLVLDIPTCRKCVEVRKWMDKTKKRIKKENGERDPFQAKKDWPERAREERLEGAEVRRRDREEPDDFEGTGASR